MYTARAAAGVAHPSLTGRDGPEGCDRSQISCHVRRRHGLLLQQRFAMLCTSHVRCCAGICSRLARFQGSCGRLLGCWSPLLGAAGEFCCRGSTACLRRCRCS